MDLFFKTIKNLKNLFILFITGILIFTNWAIWLYALSTNQIIDASFGYFIMPILSVLFGTIFFKEKLNNKKIISILLVLISIIYLLYKFNSVPLVGISVGLAWSIYNLLRKTINVDTDIGLLVESLFILPFAIIVFYLIVQNNLNDFSFSNPSLMFLIFLAGPMTIIPLFLHIKGVELAGLGPSGMIFYIVPTLHFILGYFYYNEPFSNDKFISFILIWIAVFIYLKDLYENN
jgi:chloramphenicol-sensitive protein RarD